MTYTIAVDCDEVLIESIRHLTLFSHTYYQTNRSYEDFRYYLISRNPHIGLTDEQAILLFDQYFVSPDARDALPVAGAYTVLQQWKAQGHRMIVVTARNDLAKPITFYQIEKHYPGIFEGIVFAHHYTENHIPKSQLCKDIGATILIEDNIDYALEVAEHGIASFLLAKPWNIWRGEESPHMTRVATWNDIRL